MKPLILIALVLICMQPLFTAVEKKIRVGVIDFTPKGISDIESSAASDIFRNELVASERFDVLDRNNMENILKEQALQQTGCTESACAVKIGRVLNMQYMFYGTFLKMGTAMYIAVDMINVETAKIEKSARVKVESIDTAEDSIKDLVAQFSGKKQQKKASSYVTKGFGVLSVTSSPSDADVYVDGAFAGKTKLFQEVRTGNHRIKVARPGCLPKEFEEIVEEGQTREINIILQKGIGIDEAEAQKTATFTGILWKGGTSAALFGLMTTGLLLGRMYAGESDNLLTSYNADLITASATSLGDRIAGGYDVADAWYLIAESSMVAAIAFAVWTGFDVYFHLYYSDLTSKLKSSKTSFSVLPRIDAVNGAYGLTAAIRF
ncbi:MAG: PEGA domain-containing protein [Spirochaetes bacterium]|nr:PEGA domain-containing protein [Spirochaetota bacterium]